MVGQIHVNLKDYVHNELIISDYLYHKTGANDWYKITFDGEVKCNVPAPPMKASMYRAEKKLYVVARNFCLALPGSCLSKHKNIFLIYLCTELRHKASSVLISFPSFSFAKNGREVRRSGGGKFKTVRVYFCNIHMTMAPLANVICINRWFWLQEDLFWWLKIYLFFS